MRKRKLASIGVPGLLVEAHHRRHLGVSFEMARGKPRRSKAAAAGTDLSGPPRERSRSRPSVRPRRPRLGAGPSGPCVPGMEL